MRRDLVSVTTGQVIGSVELVGERATFNEYANDALVGWRRKLGDLETARVVMAGGWSNGYAYFTEPTP